ncbi:MAG: FG-GAP repeat protein [Planctomycetota bacterium]
MRLTGGDINGAEKVGASLWKSGNLVFSGAPGEHVNGVSINGGAVYVHEKDTLTGAWTEIAKLEPTSLVARENFGTDLDGQGNTLVIGAPDQSLIVATTTGSVFVMSHGGNGVNWTVDQVLTPSDGAIGDQFGMSVAISERHTVGSPKRRDRDQPRCGLRVREHRRVWTEVQKILAPAGTTGSGYGMVEIEGDVMLIGSSFANLGGINGGLLEAYMLDGAGIWQEHQHVTGSDEHRGLLRLFDQLHRRVLAVGSANDDDVVNNCGSVYVFRWDALNMLFLQEARLVRKYWCPWPRTFGVACTPTGCGRHRRGRRF